MKKSTAFLVICTALVCVFSSCGKNAEKESSVSEDISVSDSAKTETTAKTEITAKTETTSKTKTTSKIEEKTESETTTKAKESTTESKTEKITTSAPKKETKNEKSEITKHEYIKNADPTAFIGKWECKKMVVEGEETTDFMGIPVYAVFQLDIKDDNTAS
ncbi:MAG: hypothetical protein K2G14_00390, partial [Ruminococcus sp.]|nr:hypothetical protein [Ruminococcus sp.]